MSDGSASHPQASREHIGIWWDLFYNKVQPSLNAAMSGLAASFADMNIKTVEAAAAAVVLPTEAAKPDPKPKGMTEQEHREAWERGEIDYKGIDAFDNLMKKMRETMERKKKSTTPPRKL